MDGLPNKDPRQIDWNCAGFCDLQREITHDNFARPTTQFYVRSRAPAPDRPNIRPHIDIGKSRQQQWATDLGGRGW